MPDAPKDSLKLEFGDEELGLMEDEASGQMVLRDPQQTENVTPFSASFAPHADEAGAPVEPPSDHQKRMTEKRCQKKDARHLVVAATAFLTTFCRHEDCPTR